jgi:hypothetical protein
METEKIKNLTLPKEMSSIYAEVDGLSLQNLFYANNGYFPCCYMFSRSSREYDYYFDVETILKELLEFGEPENTQYIKYVTKDMETKEETMGFCIIFKDKNIYSRLERNVSECYVLYDNNNDGSLKDFLEILERNYVAPEEEKNNLYKIAQTSAGFCLQKSHIKEVADFSIERQYNDDFPHEDTKINKFVDADDKSGLVILHGEKGTGKTTYIRNLITTHPNKKFVFVTPDLVNLLGTPSFTTFINTLNNHIIILEDCENVIRDRKTTGANSAVSTLLNMSDGLLADDLGIKFICTFNEDIKDIDSALMRKGRLVCKYEFKPLTVEKTNALLEYIYTKKAEKENEAEGIEDDVDENGIPEIPKLDSVEFPVVTKGLTLADIYNFEEDSYETARKKII